ncbi:MAG: CehA/McbA family metallohydrolase, partial [Myxococcales bacterium]|nr:CehA/McbA family metallohydrolase [Myxococcales bacterium]
SPAARPEPAQSPTSAPTSDPVAAQEPVADTWLKGQLHMHSAGSGDSETPIAQALAWYAERGFDFVVITDHNVVTEAPAGAPILALPGIELTQNFDECDPPPGPGLRCLLHVNALVVDPARVGGYRFPPPPSITRHDLYLRAIRAGEALGGVAMLNHPNFHLAADAELLTALAGDGLLLFEVANEAVDSNNEGDAEPPSTEALWDLALSRGARLYGTASDDAHHYFDAEAVAARGEQAFTGDRGFVVVRAAREPAAIRAALARGDFYASTGPRLRALERGDGAIAVELEAPATIEFIANGEVVRRVEGRAARMAIDEVSGAYLRARVTTGEGGIVWTQPIWRDG